MYNYMGYGRYYGYGFGNDWTVILLLAATLFVFICSTQVKSTYKKYAKVMASCGMTGAEVAAKILNKEGIYDVSVGHINGELSDNFNPGAKTVYLSDSVYSSRSIAAISVAAHECGHAMQHNEDYFPLKIRSAIVPVANFGSKLGYPIILVGFFFSALRPLVSIGIILFAASVAFQLATLPVEFDASKRALAVIEEMGIVTDNNELGAARKMLKSAAMTYVAAAAAAIMSLIRLIIIFGGRGKRRD